MRVKEAEKTKHLSKKKKQINGKNNLANEIWEDLKEKERGERKPVK